QTIRLKKPTAEESVCSSFHGLKSSSRKKKSHGPRLPSCSQEIQNTEDCGVSCNNVVSACGIVSFRWPAIRQRQEHRDLPRVPSSPFMLRDAKESRGHVRRQLSSSPPISHRSPSPIFGPRSLNEKVPVHSCRFAASKISSLCESEAHPSTTQEVKTHQDGDEVALRRSITALGNNWPPNSGKTPATHSTAFQRCPSGKSRFRRRTQPRPRIQPILFFLYLVTLLMQTFGNHARILAAAEVSPGSSSRHTRRDAAAPRHPYNEYSWELNQLNPWLSACDLAGPAPTDLQGSCGPPEVPKICPVSCTDLRRRKDTEDHFDDVIELLQQIANRVPSTVAAASTVPKSKRAAPSSGSGSRIKQGNYVKSSKESDRVRRTTVPEQCLFYLEDSHKTQVCDKDFGRSGSRSFSSTRENRYWFMSGLRLRHCCEHAALNALAPGKSGPLEAVLNGGEACIKALDKLLLVDSMAARLHCEFGEVLARYDCSQSYSVIHTCSDCK
ncbi:hypothetical protein QAD02_022953, partial [Eretmocerus hayati]